LRARGNLSSNRGDVDNGASAIREHPLPNFLREKEWAPKVHREHAVPIIACDVRRQLLAHDSGRVDENVDAATPFVSLHDNLPNCADIGDVADERKKTPPERTHRIADRLEPLDRTRNPDNVGSCLPEGNRNCPPNAPTCPDNKSPLTAKIRRRRSEHHLPAGQAPAGRVRGGSRAARRQRHESGSLIGLRAPMCGISADHRTESGQDESTVGCAETDFHRHSDLDGIGSAALEVRDDQRAIDELHGDQNDGNVGIKRRILRTPDQGVRVNRAEASDRFPAKIFREAAWASDSRVIDNLPTVAAMLQKKRSFSGSIEVRPIPVGNVGCGRRLIKVCIHSNRW
jgi:hypothetical protein